MTDEIQRVAIAVVEHAGCYLVGMRKSGQVLSGFAEFPGGKCLPNEERSRCAIRECREETGLDVTAIRQLSACRHTYPHGTVELEFWLCRPSEGAATAIAGDRGYEWVPAQALKSLPFPDANRTVIELLTAAPDRAG